MIDKKLKENTVEVPLLEKHIQTGIPTKTISIAAIVGFIATYTHFFGLSYRKSYLEGAGFESINITLSPDESIFYASQGFMRALVGLMSVDFLAFNWSQMMVGSVFVVIWISFYLAKKVPFIKKINQSIQSKKLSDLINDCSDSFIKTLVVSTIVFVVSCALQIVVGILIISALSMFWLLMYLGIGTGESDGSKLLLKPICNEVVWEDMKVDRILGCRIITLKDESELIGVRLHKDDNATYFLTNEGSYEISKNNEVMTFRPVHIRPQSNSEDESQVKK